MTEGDIDFHNKIVRLSRIACKLLSILDFVTLGLIHDRLVYQGEILVKLVEQSKNEIET